RSTHARVPRSPHGRVRRRAGGEARPARGHRARSARRLPLPLRDRHRTAAHDLRSMLRGGRLRRVPDHPPPRTPPDGPAARNGDARPTEEDMLVPRRSSKALRALLAAALGALFAACASERAPISHVQPNALDKTFFVGKDLESAHDDPEFYTQATVVDVGYGAVAGLFTSS